MDALGKQILLELRACDTELLNDVKFVKETMINAAKAAKATIIQSSFHTFNPYGISGMVIIAESHLAIHTWPEYGYAAVDIFTCGDTIHPEEAAHFLINKFKSQNPTMLEINRGSLYLEAGKLRYKASA